jgi:hypothetical protein
MKKIPCRAMDMTSAGPACPVAWYSMLVMITIACSTHTEA